MGFHGHGLSSEAPRRNGRAPPASAAIHGSRRGVAAALAPILSRIVTFTRESSPMRSGDLNSTSRVYRRASTPRSSAKPSVMWRGSHSGDDEPRGTSTVEK